MSTPIPTKLLLFSLMVLCACVTRYKEPEAGQSQPEEFWRGKLAKVQVGMNRAEVERILMPWPGSPLNAIHLRRGQQIIYWVDPGWKVTLVYDYTGVAALDGPTAFTKERGRNKLLQPVELVHEAMPEGVDIGTLQFGGGQ